MGVVLLAWKTGIELYVFLPSRHLHRPPTDPWLVLMLLAIPVVMYFFSQHYALVAFSIFTAGVFLGSVIGFPLFAWTPSILQLVLTATTVGAAAYGWAQREYFDY